MSLDDVTNGYHQDALDRGELPTPRRRAINMVDEKDLALESLAERIAGCRDELAYLERRYAEVKAYQPDFYDPDPSTRERPGIDPRLFDQGTDVSETYRAREDSLPRSMVNVSTGGRT